MAQKKMRLDKLIASMGYGSRKDVKSGIKKGLALVDGKVIKDPGFGVIEGQSKVSFKGREIVYETYQYYMMHKPAGVITATEDRRQETVLDLIKEETRKDLFPVGRLDKDTEGLLLITNDGDLCHNLLSPRKHVEKLYYAEIDGVVTEEDVQQFSQGVELDTGYTTMPARLQIIDSGQISKIRIIIKEGKFHQIKKMFEAVHKKVIYLKRLEMGPLVLDENLDKGAYRRLTDNELAQLLVYKEGSKC